MPRLYAPPKQGVCAKSAKVVVPPWPPPIRPPKGHCGADGSKPLARTTVELESRTTQI